MILDPDEVHTNTFGSAATVKISAIKKDVHVHVFLKSTLDFGASADCHYSRRAVRRPLMFSILKQSSSYFSCLGECCYTVWQWSSRNVLCTMKLHLTVHQDAGRGWWLDLHFWVNCSFKWRTGIKVCQKSRHGIRVVLNNWPRPNGTKQQFKLDPKYGKPAALAAAWSRD